MKRFVFRQAQLLALKEQQLTVAELALAEAAHRVASARAAVNSDTESINALSMFVLNNQHGGLTHASQTAVGLRRRLESSRQHLTKCESALKAAQANLQQARLAAEALHTLRSSRLREYRADRRKQEQAELDFNATRRWMMRET